MGQKQTSTSRADPWAPTQPGLQQIIGDAASLYKSGGFGVKPFAGDWTAARTADTTAGQAGLRGLIPGMASRAGGAADYVASIAGPQNFDQIKANTIADIMPSINSSFAGSGMTGSTLHQQNLAKGLAAGLGGVEVAARDQSMRAAGMVPGMNDAAMNPYRAQMAMGQDQQAYDQSVIDANMRKDLMGQTGGMSALQQYAQLLSGLGGQFGTQTNTQRSNMGLGGLLGLGLQAAPLFSDRRLKDDIRRIGTADNGLPIYAYRYKGGKTVHIGVMADEALEAFPEAVSESHGMLLVDYGRVF
ncbi:MAG: tail fiber domain-containing protein [Aestuariivirga sp.]